MARPSNEGLDYFPLDTDYFESMEIMTVAELFGAVGELIALKLTAWIYKHGYFVEWTEMTEKIFAKRVMFNAEAPVHDVVECLFDAGYLSREVFNRTGKLTSRGIQKRWIAAQKACKRPSELDPDLDLLTDEKDDSGNLPESSGNLPESPGKPPENSSLNKIKEKNINTITPPTPPAGGSEGAFEECSEPGEMLAYSHEVVTAWNETFHGTEREVDAVNQPLKQNYRAALIAANNEGITLEQFRRAFSVLRDTPRLSWQLHSAIKPDNVRMLLTEGENARQVRAVARSGPVIPAHREGKYATAEEFWGQ